MRKILFAILALVLLIIVGLVIYKGTSIGDFEIWGIKQINEQNEKIEQANIDLEKLINNKYPDTEKALNDSSEKMQESKKKYEEQAVLISNSKYYMQTEKYKLEFLWTRIGNYAKDYKITPKMDVASTSTKGVYNLIITVVGNYHNIASFIHAIENDSRLGFKIEDFKMLQYDGEGQSNLVQATFTCKEIRIDIKSIDTDESDTKKNSTETTDEAAKSNTTDTNTTNTTNSNTTTNTTDVNNTNNTTAAENTTSTTNTIENNINASNAEQTASANTM